MEIDPNYAEEIKQFEILQFAYSHKIPTSEVDNDAFIHFDTHGRVIGIDCIEGDQYRYYYYSNGALAFSINKIDDEEYRYDFFRAVSFDPDRNLGLLCVSYYYYKPVDEFDPNQAVVPLVARLEEGYISVPQKPTKSEKDLIPFLGITEDDEITNDVSLEDELDNIPLIALNNYGTLTLNATKDTMFAIKRAKNALRKHGYNTLDLQKIELRVSSYIDLYDFPDPFKIFSSTIN